MGLARHTRHGQPGARGRSQAGRGAGPGHRARALGLPRPPARSGAPGPGAVRGRSCPRWLDPPGARRAGSGRGGTACTLDGSVRPAGQRSRGGRGRGRHRLRHRRRARRGGAPGGGGSPRAHAGAALVAPTWRADAHRSPRASAGRSCGLGGSRWRSQRAARRPAGLRKDHAGPRGPRPPPAAVARGGSRSEPRAQRRGAAGRRSGSPASLSRAASHGEPAGVGGGRLTAAPGRGQPGTPRRAVPRRAARVRTDLARGPAAASRGRIPRREPRGSARAPAQQRGPRSRDEPLSLRMARGGQSLPMRRA